MCRSHWRRHAHSNTIEVRRRHSNTVDHLQLRSNAGDGTLTDFCCVQTDWQQLHTFDRRRQRSNVINDVSYSESAVLKSSNGRFLRPSPLSQVCHWRRSNVVDDICSNVVDEVRMHQWVIPFDFTLAGLQTVTPLQRICGRRPVTAHIWIRPHTGWTTTLVLPTNAGQSIQHRAAIPTTSFDVKGGFQPNTTHITRNVRWLRKLLTQRT